MEFEAVVAQYKPMIFSVLKKLNITIDREDYIQIALIAMWEATRNHHKQVRDLPNYVYRVIYYAIIDEIRRQAKYQQREQPHEILFETPVFQQNERVDVEHLLKCLSKKERLLVELYYLIGLKDEEIGKRLDVTTQSVKKRRQRAIKKIKTHYERLNF